MLEAAEDAQLEGSATTTEDAMAVVRQRFGSPVGWTDFVTASGVRLCCEDRRQNDV